MLQRKEEEDMHAPHPRRKWRPSYFQAHALMLLATLIYATWNVVNVSMGQLHISPLAFVLYRQAGGSLLLITWLVASEWRLPPTHRMSLKGTWKHYILLGLLMTCMQVIIMVGASLTTATTVGIFQCLEPSVAALVGCLTRFERQEGITGRMVAAAIAGSGVLIIISLRPGSSSEGEGEQQQHGANLRYLTGCGLLLIDGLVVSL